jgi:hypothetical protein
MKKKALKIYLNEDIARKLSVVSKNEKMTIQNELLSMIRQKISYYERVKGTIKKDEISSTDMSDFFDEE